MGPEGFEPPKAQGQQIYSLPRLTASLQTRASDTSYRLRVSWEYPEATTPSARVFLSIFHLTSEYLGPSEKLHIIILSNYCLAEQSSAQVEICIRRTWNTVPDLGKYFKPLFRFWKVSSCWWIDLCKWITIFWPTHSSTIFNNQIGKSEPILLRNYFH